MSRTVDVSGIVRPQWLGKVSGCPFCGAEAEVGYSSANPLVANVRCGCGYMAVVTPPDEYVTAGMVMKSLRHAGF